MKYPMESGSVKSGILSAAGLRRALRGVKVNWYQVAVVAIATFAIAMDLMFPPVMVAIGHSLGVFTGHIFAPLPTVASVQVDFARLAVELLTIVTAAIAGWAVVSAISEKRELTPGAA